MRGASFKTKTVIWTAGVKPNSFYQKINGFQFDKNGRVLVDEHLQARGLENIFIIGDAASTLYAGMAQTAIADGQQAAKNIIHLIKNQPMKKYRPRKPYHSIPVGPGWAATLLDSTAIYGYPGWLLRRAADLRYFLSILPLKKAILAFRSGKTLCESCEVCENSSALL